jgi:hypothetical protein
MIAVQDVGAGRWFVLSGDTVRQYGGDDADPSGNRRLARNRCGPAAGPAGNGC